MTFNPSFKEHNKKYQGWTMVVMMFIIYASSTVSTNCLSLFYPKLKEEFGWTNAQVVQPNAFYFIYIALLAPFIGFLLGKIKATKLILFGVGLGAILTVCFSQMTQYYQFHLIFFMFSIAIACSGLLPSLTIINRWFVKKRGMATGIFLIGSSFGGIVLPQIARYFIEHYNWRIGAIAVAITAFMLGAITLFFLKEKPDNETNDNTFEQNPQVETSNFSLISLATSPTFLLLIFITASFWFCGFGILQNLILYLTQDCKFSLLQAAGIMSLFSVNSMIGKISFGYLSDRFQKLNILILATISLVAGLIFLKLTVVNSNFAFCFVVAYGIGYSGAFTMIQVTVAEFYKGPLFSKVLGIVSSIDALGGFLGVFLMGKLSTQYKSYDLPILLLIAVAILAFVLSIVLKIYRQKTLVSLDNHLK